MQAAGLCFLTDNLRMLVNKILAPMLTETKLCLNCGSAVYGRTDKKFCDDHCRTTYNNRFKVTSPAVKNINAALRKNRKILESFVPEEEFKAIIPSNKLAETGFNFTYHTHAFANGTGVNCFFCYEYGYQRLENAQIMVVKSTQG